MRYPLLLNVPDFRHGLLLPASLITPTLSDIGNYYNAGIPLAVDEAHRSAAGGVGRSEDEALVAAIGEGIERYVAQTALVPTRKRTDITENAVEPHEWSLFNKEQIKQPDFPYKRFYNGDIDYAQAYSLLDSGSVWVPASLIGLRANPGEEFITSNGLAAGPSRVRALLRGAQELVERDAFMTMWRHGLSLPQFKPPEEYAQLVRDQKGTFGIIDITPHYSPHPVALVYGEAPMSGRRRLSIGIACRETMSAAIDKAFMEWVQGIIFNGVRYRPDMPASLDSPDKVRSFEDHALYYTANPAAWDTLPMWNGKIKPMRDERAVPDNPAGELEKLTQALNENNIKLLYRDLTTPETSQTGVFVVRVLSPQLVGLNADARYPFLGGTAKDVKMRFNVRGRTKFPLYAPHPLG